MFVSFCRARHVISDDKLMVSLPSRLSLRISPAPTNQLGQLQATSHPPTSHIRCVPSAYPFHLQQAPRRQCELTQQSAAAFTARHLLPACLPNHCWLCEAGRYRPVSSSSLLCPSSLITLKPTPQPCHGHPSVMQALQMRKRRRSSDADGHGRDVQPLDKVRCC